MPTIVDDFNRANQGGLGTPWAYGTSGSSTNPSSVWSISNNQAKVTVNTSDDYYAFVDPGTADQDVRVTMPTSSGFTNSLRGLVLRWPSAANGVTSGVIVTRTDLFLITGGNYTAISHGVPYSDNDVMRARIQGTTLWLYRNGSMVFSKSDMPAHTGTRAGLYAGANGQTYLFDNFSAAPASGVKYTLSYYLAGDDNASMGTSVFFNRMNGVALPDFTSPQDTQPGRQFGLYQTDVTGIFDPNIDNNFTCGYKAGADYGVGNRLLVEGSDGSRYYGEYPKGFPYTREQYLNPNFNGEPQQFGDGDFPPRQWDQQKQAHINNPIDPNGTPSNDRCWFYFTVPATALCCTQFQAIETSAGGTTQVTFTDDFQRPLGTELSGDNGWSAVTTGLWSIQADETRNVAKLTATQSPTADGYTLLLRPTDNLTKHEVQAHLTNAVPGGGAALIFSYKSDTDFYYARYAGDGRLEVRKYAGGRTTLASYIVANGLLARIIHDFNTGEIKVYNDLNLLGTLTGHTRTVGNRMGVGAFAVGDFVDNFRSIETVAGGGQKFVVPKDVTVLDVTLYGAEGGWYDPADTSLPGGKGGALKCSINVTPGETLTLRVGRRGNHGPEGQSNAYGAALGGHGQGDVYSGGYGVSGGGGGGTGIFRGNTLLAIAGGGGGSSGWKGPGSGGGHGGSVTGGAGEDGNGTTSGGSTAFGLGGKGGSQTAGGAGGTGSGGAGQAGSYLQGGNRGSDNQDAVWAGGGGGGGYYGGGGGGAGNSQASGGGGGGGSSWYAPSTISVSLNQQGFQTGHGFIEICHICVNLRIPSLRLMERDDGYSHRGSQPRVGVKSSTSAQSNSIRVGSRQTYY